jgi:hypothetical protein
MVSLCSVSRMQVASQSRVFNFKLLVNCSSANVRVKGPVDVIYL